MIHNRQHRRLPAMLGATTILAAGLGLMACGSSEPQAQAQTPTTTEAPESTEVVVGADEFDGPACPAIGDAVPAEFEGCLDDGTFHLAGTQTYDDGCEVIIWGDGMWGRPGGVVADGWGESAVNPCLEGAS